MRSHMIKHVVCFRLKNAALVPQWQELSVPLESIETVQNFAALPLLEQSRFHCALYMEFDDQEGLKYYQEHPTHLHYVRESIPPVMKEKLVVDLVG